MPVFKRPRSPYWWYSFTVNGRRFRGSTQAADRATAEIIEAKLRHDALIQGVTGRRPEMTLDAAFGRYFLEVADFQTTADDTARASARILARLGKSTLLSEVGTDQLAGYIAKRRGDRIGKKPKKGPDPRRLVSNATVNRDLELLRRVFRRADKTWKVAVAEIEWGELLLPEAAERVRHLSTEEEDRLLANLRPDFWPLVLFAALSGLRRSAVVELTWPQVDWRARCVHVVLKSREPGGRPHTVPLTAPMLAILQQQLGNHPERVFTYTAARTRRCPYSGLLQVEGRRYPFTRNGWRRAWVDALQKAGVANFRFHDLRHTAATRLLAATGNLKAVQKLLGHTEIATTARYAHVDTAELSRLMDLAHEAAARLRHTPQAEPAQAAEKPGKRRSR